MRPDFRPASRLLQLVAPALGAFAAALLFVSAVNIYKAMGGGWVGEADSLTGSTPEAPPASALPTRLN
jgi:hypothetical protein